MITSGQRGRDSLRRLIVILSVLFVVVWTARWWSKGNIIVERVRPSLPAFSRQIQAVKRDARTAASVENPVKTKMPPVTPVPQPNQSGRSSLLKDPEQIRQYLKSTLIQLESLGREAIPTGRLTLDQTNDMGFRSTIEETQTGDTVARTYDVSGSMLGEKWKTAKGEEIIRTFRADGQVEGVYYQRRDGTSSSVSWSREGRLHSKKDDLGNGELIYTLYDSSGYESQVWKKTKDGRNLRLDN